MLFEDSTVIPEQFFGSRRRSAVQGERRLLLAVMEEAIDCYCKTSAARDTRSMNLFREAEEWIFGEDRSRCFTFCNICEVLEIDAQCVRSALAAWRERRIRSRSPAQADRLRVRMHVVHSNATNGSRSSNRVSAP
ncbi:MAG: hypothetical protein QOD06_1886 [Candidatus Binatota bacterium]|nr:hypothetical protein [Candidatus Binatota bacterium]